MEGGEQIYGSVVPRGTTSVDEAVGRCGGRDWYIWPKLEGGGPPTKGLSVAIGLDICLETVSNPC